MLNMIVHLPILAIILGAYPGPYRRHEIMHPDTASCMMDQGIELTTSLNRTAHQAKTAS
jgi:hypothetical protein